MGTNLRKVSKIKTKVLIKVANKPYKDGLARVGVALQKHGSRANSKFPKVQGNRAAINTQAKKVLEGILSNPSVQVVKRHHARFGNIVEYKSPNRQGARFTADDKTFIGFIE